MVAYAGFGESLDFERGVGRGANVRAIRIAQERKKTEIRGVADPMGCFSTVWRKSRPSFILLPKNPDRINIPIEGPFAPVIRLAIQLNYHNIQMWLVTNNLETKRGIDLLSPYKLCKLRNFSQHIERGFPSVLSLSLNLKSKPS